MKIIKTKLTPREHILYADVYDYHVKKCWEKREELVIEFEGEEMVIPPSHLKSGVSLTDQVFQSKWGGKSYKLISFVWKPLTEEEKEKRYLL